MRTLPTKELCATAFRGTGPSNASSALTVPIPLVSASSAIVRHFSSRPGSKEPNTSRFSVSSLSLPLCAASSRALLRTKLGVIIFFLQAARRYRNFNASITNSPLFDVAVVRPIPNELNPLSRHKMLFGRGLDRLPVKLEILILNPLFSQLAIKVCPDLRFWRQWPVNGCEKWLLVRRVETLLILYNFINTLIEPA